MGLFNRKKKEIEVEFNYEEMMEKAKMVYSNTTIVPIPTEASSEDLKEIYYTKLVNSFKGSRFNYVRKISTNSDDINEKYEITTDETNYVGVHDKNNKLLLTFEIDLDKLYLYKYLINYTNFTERLKKVDIQPISIIEINKELLSNYLIEDVLLFCINNYWVTLSDDITNHYITTCIEMYINNLNETNK